MPWHVTLTLIMFSLLSGCSITSKPPSGISIADRLAAFPVSRLPLEGEAAVYWNEYQVPFVEASSDKDLAFILGMVQAHLRLAQLELMRRASQGRLAEVAGPPAVDIDKAIRILNPGRAAREIEAMLPASTREHLENFVHGINHYWKSLKTKPHELKVLAIEYEPWTLRDILVLSRLMAADVNWIFISELLPILKEPAFPGFWERLLKYGDASIPGMGARGNELAAVLAGVSKSGSNSFVAGSSKTTSGKPLMGNDPHVGLNLPNLWLIAGMKSPSFNAVGFMLPGLPAFVIGRNQHIAWGGTNMMALSSDLVDLSNEPQSAFKTEKEKIKVRFWRDSEVTRRISRFGPVVSDAPFLKNKVDRPLALRWQGHKASDEITAFLKMNQAANFEEFRQAFSTYAVSGQNFTYADNLGNIGQMAAARLPTRRSLRRALIQEPRDLSEETLGPLDLPFLLNPASDLIVSANNRPFSDESNDHSRFEVSFFATTNDRVERITFLLNEKPLGIDSARDIQKDVQSPSSLRLRDEIAAHLRPWLSSDLPTEQSQIVNELSAWEGNFESGSRGALVFSLFVYYLADGYYGEQFGDSIKKYLLSSQALNSFLLDDLSGALTPEMESRLRRALMKTASRAKEFSTWGDMHKLVLKHPLSRLPLAGDNYVFAREPASGSSLTVMKTAHRMTDEVHETRYGANARHISDLSDPDANYFVLLGGEDGFLGSENFLDQFAVWNGGATIQVPLNPEKARMLFPHAHILKPLE